LFAFIVQQFSAQVKSNLHGELKSIEEKEKNAFAVLFAGRNERKQLI
jgi:hypothetical protein